MALNLEWYRSFIAVYQAGTVTSAADTLFLTQPAVSQHISSLENSLGVALFERKSRKMIPTDDGKAIYARIISSINILETTTNQYRNAKNTNSRSLIRMGSPREIFHRKMIGVFGADNHTYRVLFARTGHLLAELERGKLDVVIATKKENSSKVIEYKKLFSERFVIVQSSKANSSLRQYTETNIDSPQEALLLQQDWISYDPDLPIIRRYWREVFHSRPAIAPTICIPDLNIICKAVELGKGISVLPYYICEDSIHAGLIEVVGNLNYNVENDIWVVYRKEDLQDPNILRFVNRLVNHFIGKKPSS